MATPKKVSRLLHFTALGLLAATLLFLINPLYLMLALLSMFAMLMIARNMNFYKMVMMLKRFARETSKLQLEIHALLHTGFRDSVSLDEENGTRGRNAGFVR